jgi:hypothetical protein
MNRGIEDARRMLCVQEAYDFHCFIRDQVVHHPFREFSPVPDTASVMGRLSPRMTRALRRHGCSHRMGLSRHVIPVSPVILILMLPITYYIDHFTSSSANFETALSLLSSFFVPEDNDALLSWIEQMLCDKKLRLQIAQWRQDWVQLVASGRDGDALL